MIQVVHQGDNHYKVYDSGEDVGCISVSQNPYHNRHLYLNLELRRYDPSIAAELQHELNRPLQVMLYASESMHDFLIAGGFERRRRCYEWEARAEDLAVPLEKTVPLAKVLEGSAEYDLYGDGVPEDNELAVKLLTQAHKWAIPKLPTI